MAVSRRVGGGGLSYFLALHGNRWGSFVPFLCFLFRGELLLYLESNGVGVDL
jgi:hypothetical protein